MYKEISRKMQNNKAEPTYSTRFEDHTLDMKTVLLRGENKCRIFILNHEARNLAHSPPKKVIKWKLYGQP